jgi:hypothetical protein
MQIGKLHPAENLVISVFNGHSLACEILQVTSTFLTSYFNGILLYLSDGIVVTLEKCCLSK